MYVCNCRGLRRRDIDSAIAQGAHSPRAVHARCGSEPQCGKCLVEIAAYLREARAKKDSAADASLAAPAR